jgi:ABC-type antimicrobial peptide transport system permease subunit
VGFKVGEPLEEFIGNGIYMTIEDARMLANLTKAKSINGIMLKTSYSDEVAQKISNNNDGLVRKVFIKGEYRESMESALGQKQVFLDTFFMGGLLIGIAITVMVVSTMISERKREFINFRAIGVTNPEIYKVILSELLVIGAIGLGLGLLVSIPAMNGLANFMTSFGFIISSAYTIMDLVVTSILIMISVVIAAWLSLRDLFKTRISEFLVSRVIG